jgi:hypothetical protein
VLKPLKSANIGTSTPAEMYSVQSFEVLQCLKN